MGEVLWWQWDENILFEGQVHFSGNVKRELMNELTLVSYKLWGRVLNRRCEKTEIGKKKKQLMSKAFLSLMPKGNSISPTNHWLDYHLSGNYVLSIMLETKKKFTFNNSY